MSGPKVQYFEGEESLRAFVQARPWITFLIGLQARVGVGLCNVALEWLLYPPASARNRFFHALLMAWGDLNFTITGVPRRDELLWRPVVKACGLRVANGVPCLLISAPQLAALAAARPSWPDLPPITKFCPLTFDHCFTLEWPQDHPIRTDSAIEQQLQRREDLLVRKLQNGWHPNNADLRAAFLPESPPEA